MIRRNETTTAIYLEDLYVFPFGLRLAIGILYMLTALLAITGNGLIILVVWRSKSMRSLVTNLFIANVAMADLIAGFLVAPFQFQASLLQEWIIPDALCKIIPFSFTLSVNVSIFTLCVTSVDRWHAINRGASKLSRRMCLGLIALIWLVSIALAAPYLLQFGVSEFAVINHNFSVIKRCEKSEPLLPLSDRDYTILLTVVQYPVPFVIICVTYSLIAHKAYFKKTPAIISENRIHERNRRRVIKMIFTVVLLFMLSWMPYQTYQMLSAIYPQINFFEYINIIFIGSHWLAISNSCYNVFIYAFCSARYKKEFCLFFGTVWPCCQRCCPELQLELLLKKEQQCHHNTNNTALNLYPHSQQQLMQRQQQCSLTMEYHRRRRQRNRRQSAALLAPDHENFNTNRNMDDGGDDYSGCGTPLSQLRSRQASLMGMQSGGSSSSSTTTTQQQRKQRVSSSPSLIANVLKKSNDKHHQAMLDLLLTKQKKETKKKEQQEDKKDADLLAQKKQTRRLSFSL